jgi:hypothetical protein
MTIRLPIVIVLLLALGQAGCGSHSSVQSTAPTPATSSVALPPVQSGPQEIWILTGTYAGHTGPAACIPPFDATAVQTPITGPIIIQRSGESIDVITEHDHYVGTVVADAYSATDSDVGTWQCGAVRFNFRSEGHVSGHFSADGRSLTGEEGVVFRLESGETITRRWEWHATRQ